MNGLTNALLVLICSIAYFSVHSQPLEEEKLLSSSTLPEVFVQSPIEKYQQIIDGKGLDLAKTTDQEKMDFYRESTYFFDEYLRSGSVIYNDPIGVYLTKVLQEILQANPDFPRQDAQVFVVRSSDVNAFAVDQGVIFVTIGLLAQLETEAQLALILAHELIHIDEEHAVDGFLEENRIEDQFLRRGKLDEEQFEMANFEKKRYSREQEIEADDKGLDLFLKTNYAHEELIRVFEVLRYAYLPFDEIPFELDFLRIGSINIPDNYRLERVQEINPAEEDEAKSTHPALSQRIEQMQNRLIGSPSGDKKHFLVSEEEFRKIQYQSRVALARVHLEEQRLKEAIYLSFLMDKTYDESDFTKEITGKALYGLCKYRNNKATSELNSLPVESIEGQSQAVHHLIDTLTNKELNLLAIAYNYGVYQKTPDETQQAIVLDLFAELYLFHDVSSLVTFAQVPTATEDSSEKVDTVVMNKTSKLDRIRQQRQDSTQHWSAFIFANELNQPTFRELANQGFKLGKERKNQEMGDRKHHRIYQKDDHQTFSWDDLENVVVINPVFIHLTGKKNDAKLNFEEGYNRRRALSGIIEETATLNHVGVQVLDVYDLKYDQVNVLNDIIAAETWISSQFTASKFPMHSYDDATMARFVESYGTSYLMTVGAISVHSKGTGLIGRLFGKSSSLFFVIVLNVATGEKQFLNVDYYTYYLDDAFLKSQLYDAFAKLSQTKK